MKKCEQKNNVCRGCCQPVVKRGLCLNSGQDDTSEPKPCPCVTCKGGGNSNGCSANQNGCLSAEVPTIPEYQTNKTVTLKAQVNKPRWSNKKGSKKGCVVTQEWPNNTGYSNPKSECSSPNTKNPTQYKVYDKHANNLRNDFSRECILPNYEDYIMHKYNQMNGPQYNERDTKDYYNEQKQSYNYIESRDRKYYSEPKPSHGRSHHYDRKHHYKDLESHPSDMRARHSEYHRYYDQNAAPRNYDERMPQQHGGIMHSCNNNDVNAHQSYYNDATPQNYESKPHYCKVSQSHHCESQSHHFNESPSMNYSEAPSHNYSDSVSYYDPQSLKYSHTQSQLTKRRSSDSDHNYNANHHSADHHKCHVCPKHTSCDAEEYPSTVSIHRQHYSCRSHGGMHKGSKSRSRTHVDNVSYDPCSSSSHQHSEVVHRPHSECSNVSIKDTVESYYDDPPPDEETRHRKSAGLHPKQCNMY